MASASIESTVTNRVAPGDPHVNVSRDDLLLGDDVLLNSVNAGTSYTWQIAYAPEGSTATFSGSVFDQSPGTFTVDKEGPYLIRLVLSCPTVTVASAPITPGVTLNINGTVLTGVSGARTPGANDFDSTLGTQGLIAVEIAAAINDPANSFATDVTAFVDPGTFTVNVCPFSSGGSVVVVSSSASLQVDPGATNEQFVRLRALTEFGELKLVAAGERVDTIPVPVDITFTGWADEQNFNLLTLLGFVQKTEASGRMLYVDPETGDYQTIQAAMDHAQSQAPTVAAPWVVLVRPGTYVEDLTFYPWVYVFGWPGGQGTGIVKIQNATSASHTAVLSLLGHDLTLSNLYFEQTASTSNPLMVSSGAGSMTAHQCVFLSSGAGSPQGPAFEAGSTFFDAFDCRFFSTSVASSDSQAFRVASTGTATLRNCRTSVREIFTEPSSTLIMRDSEVSSQGDYAIQARGQLLNLEYCTVTGGTLGSVAFNPSGGPIFALGGVVGQIRWSRIGDLIYETTGVIGSKELYLGATEHGSLTFPSGAPSTLQATTPSSTVFYDNSTTGLTAENVQDALDEIYTFAAAVRTLDDAYDGGDPGPTGSGRTIVADAGAVQIVDASTPSDPIPSGNTNGNLEVVGSIKTGALTKPEQTLDPNPYGDGPLLLMGRVTWANNAPFGSTAMVLADSTGDPDYHNYNLRIGTKSADGGGFTGVVGRVILRGGDSLANPVDASSVYIQSGQAVDGAGGNAGNIFIAPGASAGGTDGSIFFVRPEVGTSATLTAAGAFVGGVTGTIRFATEMGAVEIDIDSGDNLAAVQAKLSATGHFTAAGDPLVLSTTATGPNAAVFFLNATAGLDAALGGFDGQAMTAGTWPEFIRVRVTGANTIEFGLDGAGGAFPGPMIYDADEGKLTVPGIIDPVGMELDETSVKTAPAGKGVIFVADGTGGTNLGDFYYRHESGVLQNISSAVSGSTTIDVEDGGTPFGTFSTLNFAGAGVSLVDAGGGVVDVNISGGGGSALETQQNTVTVEANTTILNFTGAGVTASSGGAGLVNVNVPGSSLFTAITQDVRVSNPDFSFGSGVSSAALSQTPDTTASIQGMVVVYRNGVADMNNVGPAVPTTALEYRINGSNLEIGADITAANITYRIVYPSV